MHLKKLMASLGAVICLSTCFNAAAFAETTDYYAEEISPAYEIAENPISTLSIIDSTAYCTSETRGEVVSITVEQTLEKYSGWFWIWNNVDGASWTKTVNTNTIRLSNTKSGLSSGTYRLKSVFTLTSSSGKTETITIYSAEKSI